MVGGLPALFPMVPSKPEQGSNVDPANMGHGLREAGVETLKLGKTGAWPCRMWCIQTGGDGRSVWAKVRGRWIYPSLFLSGKDHRSHQ